MSKKYSNHEPWCQILTHWQPFYCLFSQKFCLTSRAEDKNGSNPTWMDGKIKVDSLASYSRPIKSCTFVALTMQLATVTKSNALN